MPEPKLFDVAPLPGMHPEIGLLAAMLVDGTRNLREELGRVGKEALGWQPFSGGHSIGALILHNIDVEGWWIEELAAGGSRPKEELLQLLSEETKQYSVSWPKPPHKPLTWYYDLQDRVRARTLDTLKRLGDANRAIPWGAKKAFTLRWIVQHVVAHEAYHMGQAVLLKLMWAKRGI